MSPPWHDLTNRMVDRTSDTAPESCGLPPRSVTRCQQHTIDHPIKGQATFGNIVTAVAMDAVGDFVVTWSSNGQDGSGWGVYGRWFGADGSMGSEFQINEMTTGDQMYASVAMTPSGTFVVTWSSNAWDNSGWNVYARQFAARGAAASDEFEVNSTKAGDQEYSTVAMDNAGAFVIAWSSNSQDGSGWGIYSQRYDATGATLDKETQVNTTTTGDQIYPSIGMQADGNYIISWSSNGGGLGGIKAHVFLGQNSSSWGDGSDSSLSSDSGSGGQLASVNLTQSGGSTGGLGGLAITATLQTSSTSSWGVYAQQYDESGNPLGAEFRVNTTTTGTYEFSSVVMNGAGDIVVVWSGVGSNGTNGVYAQAYAVGQDDFSAPDKEAAPSANVPSPAPSSNDDPTQPRAHRLSGRASNGDDKCQHDSAAAN